MTNNLTANAIALRRIIHNFINDRLTTKLEKMTEGSTEYVKLKEQYQPEAWLADAARRVSQLQVVTHTLKAVHPYAKGSNLFVDPQQLPAHDLVGSHLLTEGFSGDVVGNAAALDVYKLLKLELDGQSLLNLALAKDPNFLAALHEDPNISRNWCDAFASIIGSPETPSSSTRAKQIYWLVGDNPAENSHYHLLSPLFPSSLVHKVYQTIQEDRFSDAAKAARQARRENKPSNIEYHDYPNLAVQKLGGTKPQNISQLNSERGGNNHLLASLPPTWRSTGIKPPLNTDSVFPRFVRRREVYWLLQSLVRFLKTDPPRNITTRQKVSAFVQSLIDELMLFSAELQTIEPGWSAQPECQLAEEEKLWLDNGRAAQDESFAAARSRRDWPLEIQSRFANQINKVIRRDLPAGESEYRHWVQSIRRNLDTNMEVSYV